jgi:hypothetical protein
MDKHFIFYKAINKLMIIICLYFVFNEIGLSENISQSSSLSQARQLFYQSVENSKTIEKAKALFEEIGKDQEYEGLTLTYIGALTALKGKFAFFPITKYRHAVKGLKLMDQGILKNPSNIESRFIRGMTCYYLPFFFKRKKTAQSDFKMIVNNLNNEYHRYDPEVIKDVTAFILENIELNAEEKEIVASIQNSIKNNEG